MLYTLKPKHSITWTLYHRISMSPLHPNLSLALSLSDREKFKTQTKHILLIYCKSSLVFDINTSIIHTPTFINKINRYSCTSEKVVRNIYKDVIMELDFTSYMSASVSWFNQHCHLIHCIGLGKSVYSFLHSSLHTQHPPPLKYLKQRRY